MVYSRRYLIFVVFLTVLATTHAQEWHIANLNEQCFKCLCAAATGCDLARGCTEEVGFCGPYKVSKIYWLDAGNVTLPQDNPLRPGAYEDCAIDYWCAQRMLKGYISNWGSDCNGDGLTDCFDYMMLNFNGRTQCNLDLNRNEFGRAWVQRYTECMAS